MIFLHPSIIVNFLFVEKLLNQSYCHSFICLFKSFAFLFEIWNAQKSEYSFLTYRQNTTLKNERSRIFFSQTKLLYFKGIFNFKVWLHSIFFACIARTILKRISIFLHFSLLYVVYNIWKAVWNIFSNTFHNMIKGKNID